MVKLFIDTRDSKRVLAKLTVDGKVFEKVSKNVNNRPESILTIINILCEKAKATINSIEEINVEQGPGSYTGLKVGVSVANALAFSLKKEVNGAKVGSLIEPRYE